MMLRKRRGSSSGIRVSVILTCSHEPRYVHILQCYIKALLKYALVVNMLVMYDINFVDEIFIRREGCNTQKIR
jgi:hypothetical protein